MWNLNEKPEAQALTAVDTGEQKKQQEADVVNEWKQRKVGKRHSQEISRAQRKMTTRAAVPAVVALVAYYEADREQGDENGERTSEQRRNAYEWNIVLNHATPRKLTQIAKSPHTDDR